MKFTVGTPVGGPTTFSAASGTDDPLGSALLDIQGVVSVFLTADFVTITKDADAEWSSITGTATGILESHFG